MSKTLEVNVVFKDNLDAVLQRINVLEQKLGKIRNTTFRLRVATNIPTVLKSLERFQHEVEKLQQMQAQVQVQVQGVQQAVQEVRQLRGELRNLRSKTVTVTMRTRMTEQTTGERGRESGGAEKGFSKELLSGLGSFTGGALKIASRYVTSATRWLAFDYPRIVFQLGRSYYSTVGNIMKASMGASLGFAGFGGGTIFGVIKNLTSKFMQFGVDAFRGFFSRMFGLVKDLSTGFLGFIINIPQNIMSAFKAGMDFFRFVDTQMRAVSQALYYFSQSITSLSTTLTAAVGIVTTGIAKLFDVIMKYKDYQYKFAVTTGIISQPEEGLGKQFAEIQQMQLVKLTRLTDIAGKIAYKTGMGFGDVVDLLYFVASSGFKGVERLGMVADLVSQYAFATDVTPTELFRSVLAVTGAFDMDTDNYETLTKVLAQISYTVAEGVFTMGEFATQIQRVVAFAEASNTSFEETLSIMAAMSQAGLKSELIGTGLSQLMMQFSRPDVIDKLKQYGVITQRYVNGEIVGTSMLEIIEQLAKYYGTDTRFWARFGRELKFEKRAMTTLLTIVDNLDNIRRILRELKGISSEEKAMEIITKYQELLTSGVDVTFVALLNRLQTLFAQAGVNFLNTVAKVLTNQANVFGAGTEGQTVAAKYINLFNKVVTFLQNLNELMKDPEAVMLILDMLYEIVKLLITLVRLALMFNLISVLTRNVASLIEILRPTTLFLVGFVKGLAKGLNASGVDFGKTIAEYVNAMIAVSEFIGEKVGGLIAVLLSFFDKFKTGEGAGFGNIAYELTYKVSIVGVDIASKVNEIADTIISEFEKYRDKISKTIASIILSGFSINLDIARTVLEGISVVVESWALAGKIGYSIARRLPTGLKGVQYGTPEYKNAISTIAEQVKAEHYAELSKVYSDAEIDKMVRTWTESFADFYMQLGKSMEEIAYNVLRGGIDWTGIGFTFLTRFFEGINKGLQDFINWAKTPEGKKTLQAFEESFGGFVKEAVRFAFKFTEALFTIMPSVIGGIAKGLQEANLPELFAGLEDEWNEVKASLQANLPSIMASILDIMMFGLEKWDDVVDIFGKSLAKNSKKIADLFYKIGELILSNAVVSSELVKGAVEGFEQYSEALLNAPDGSEMAKEWETLKNNIQKTATSFMKAAVNFAILGAELGVSFFEGLSEGFKELEKDQSKLTRFHTAVQNAVKSAVKFSIQTLPETLEVGADILNGIADGVSQGATDQAYISKLQQAISDFVQAGLRAAISGAWLVTEFGKGFAQNLVAAIDLLDRAIDNQLNTLQYNSKEGVYTYTVKFGTETVTKQLTNSDIELLKQTAQNVKDTFRTFMSATPIALDWVTGFIKAMTGEAAAYTNFVRSIMGLDNLAAADKQTLSNIMRNAKNLTEFERQVNSAKWSSNQAKTTVQNYIQALKVYGEAVQRPIDQSVWQNLNESYANLKQAIIDVANTILNSIMITATIVIKDWLFEDKSNPKTTREYLEKLLEKMFAAAFGVLWIASATGFNPAISLSLAVTITLTLASIRMGFDLFQAVRDAFKIRKEGIAVAKSPFLSTLERELPDKKAAKPAERYKLVSSILKSAEVLNIFNNVSANIKGQQSREFAESLLQAAKNIQSNLSNATQTAQVDQVLSGKGLFDIKGDFAALTRKYGNLDTISEQALNEFASLGGQLAYLEAMLFAIAYSRYGDVEEASKLTTSLISELMNDIFRTFSTMKHFGVVFDAFMTEYASTSAMLQKFYDIEKSLGSKAGKYKGGYVGYDDGGYTGVGYTYDVAGIVHKGEYVVPKWMVQKYPQIIASLETIRLRGYNSGGAAGENIIIGAAGTKDEDDIISGFLGLIGQMKSMIGIIKQLFEMQTNMFSAIAGTTEELGQNVQKAFESLQGMDISQLFKQVSDQLAAIDESIANLESSAHKIGDKLNEIKKRTASGLEGMDPKEFFKPKAKEKATTDADVVSGVIDLLFGEGTASSFGKWFDLLGKGLEEMIKRTFGEATAKNVMGFLQGASDVYTKIFAVALSPFAGLFEGTGLLEISQQFQGVSGGLVEAIGGLVSASGPLAPILAVVLQLLNGISGRSENFTKVIDGFMTIVNKIGEVLAPVIDNIFAPFVQLLEEFGMTIGYMLKPWLEAFGVVLQGLVLPVLKPMVELFKTLGKVLYIVGGILYDFLAVLYNTIATVYNMVSDFLRTITLNLINIGKMSQMEIKSLEELWKEAQNLFPASTASSSVSGYGVTSKVENINYTTYATLNFNGSIIGDRETFKQLLIEVLKELNIEIGRP